MTLHPIPDAVFAQHSAWLATSGAGKTTAVKGGVERMLSRRERVVIVDPTGVWWGLRFQRDGRRASPYEVVIFGREHADLPLEAGSGEAIARALATSSTSAILSLKGLRVGERTRFVTDFFETLAAENRGLLNLMIDEVHLFAPQSGGSGLTPAMLHATNNLVSTGRACGLRIAMISQRPAKVHKDSLTQAKSLIALQCSHPLDQKPIRDWLSTTADKAKGAEIMASLAGLPTGSGWLSAPQLGVLERVDFPMIKTFDSSKPGVAEIPLKPLDVAALRAAMAVAPAPSAVSAGPARRGSEPSAASARPASAEEIAAAETRGYERGLRDGEARRLQRGTAAGWRACAVLFERDISVVSREFAGQPGGHEDGEAEIAKALGLAAWPKATAAPPPSPARRLAARAPAPAPARMNGAVPAVDHKLGAERRILSVLASAHPAGMTEAQWAVAAGMKRSGGTWGTYKSRLRTAGAIEARGGAWFATAVGLASIGTSVEPIPAPGRELVEFWISRISGVGPMLRELAARYPRTVKRDELAEAIGMTASGGTFGTYLSRLSSAGLIEKGGAGVRAAPALMEIV